MSSVRSFKFLVRNLDTVAEARRGAAGARARTPRKNSCWSVELKVRASLAVELEAEREVDDNVDDRSEISRDRLVPKGSAQIALPQNGPQGTWQDAQRAARLRTGTVEAQLIC